MTPLSQEELQKLFHYDPITGALHWRVRPSQATKQGARAGSVHPQGYVMVQVYRRIYAAHRLIWKRQYGVDPDTIDHINGDKADNRLVNLRSVTRGKNLQMHRKTRSDSTTGLLGVTFRRDCGKYQAKIRRDGVTKHLGTFATPEEAHAAYVAEKSINS